MTITKDGGSKYTSLCPVRKPDIFTRFENPQTQISDVVKCVVLSHAYLSPATPGGVHIVPVMHQGNPWVFVEAMRVKWDRRTSAQEMLHQI